MTGRLLRATHRGLLALALTCAGTYALAQVRAHIFTALEDVRLSALLEGGRASAPVPTRRARVEARAGRAWGRLELLRLGRSAIVAEGVDAGTLGVAVGHFPESAFPGEIGNVALAGHRDSVFQMLKDVWPQDVLRLTTADGTFDYRVEWLAIVDPTRTDVVASTGEPLLTLVTCYPFDHVGSAPRRYVVRARSL
jgi:sortase A